MASSYVDRAEPSPDHRKIKKWRASRSGRRVVFQPTVRLGSPVMKGRWGFIFWAQLVAVLLLVAASREASAQGAPGTPTAQPTVPPGTPATPPTDPAAQP